MKYDQKKLFPDQRQNQLPDQQKFSEDPFGKDKEFHRRIRVSVRRIHRYIRSQSVSPSVLSEVPDKQVIRQEFRLHSIQLSEVQEKQLAQGPFFYFVLSDSTVFYIIHSSHFDGIILLLLSATVSHNIDFLYLSVLQKRNVKYKCAGMKNLCKI